MAGLALMQRAECRNAAVSSGASGVMDARGHVERQSLRCA